MHIKINDKIWDVSVADTFKKRLIGLSFKKNIKKGMLFKNCNSIQTLFMFTTIDVVLTDENYKVLYILRNVKPFRIITPKKSVIHTFEFPLNIIENLQIGDILHH